MMYMNLREPPYISNDFKTASLVLNKLDFWKEMLRYLCTQKKLPKSNLLL